jgi:colicin import membrane protein
MLQRYAAEALKEHAYKSLASAQLRQFNEAFRESKEQALAAMDAAGADVVAVPLPEREGAVLYVRRVRKVRQGTFSLRRLEEYAGRGVDPGEAQRLRELAREVEAEVAAARERDAKAQAAAERKRQREEQKEERERLREERERIKAERAEAKRAAQAARSAMDKRVRTVEKALRHSSS